MSNFYRKSTVSVAEPGSPNPGDKWIKKLATSYSVYWYLAGAWRFWISGGTLITETDEDTHYHNFISGTSLPATIQRGWYFFNETTNQLFRYDGQYVPLLSF